MIDGEREARKKWNDNTTLPLCALLVRANDAMNNRVANLVLNDYVANCRPELFMKVRPFVWSREKCSIRRDKKLIFDVNKMFGELYGCFGVRCTELDTYRSVVYMPLR
jgi:hypothetical protein